MNESAEAGAGHIAQQSDGGTLRNVMLVVEYDGTDYHGFQVQPGVPTVQQQLELALWELTGQHIRISAAGRTDAGVHARGQVVNLHTTSTLAPSVFLRALNRLLPADIAITETAEVEPGFHARFSARSREYTYRILNRGPRPAIGRQYLYHYRRQLELADMQQACDLLVGTQDFASFGAADEDVVSTIRTVLVARCERRDEMVDITIEADAFLKHMVRNIVGTLVWVATKKISVAQFRNIVLAQDRTQAGPTAPARGLCLTKVRY